MQSDHVVPAELNCIGKGESDKGEKMNTAKDIRIRQTE